MKGKITNTLPIRFPARSEVLHMSLPKEELIVSLLLFFVLCSIVGYITLVSMSIVNVIARKEAIESAAEKRSEIAQLEHDYFSLADSMTAEKGIALGFSKVTEKTFVQRVAPVGVAETHDSRNGL